MEKHPDVIAWEKWLDSEDSQKYTAPYNGGILERQYLENRLRGAFLAGIKASRLPDLKEEDGI